MNDNERNAIAWRLCTGAVIAFFLSVGGCTAVGNYNDNVAVSALVAGGQDAISAGCAIRPANIDKAICAIAAARK